MIALATKAVGAAIDPGVLEQEEGRWIAMTEGTQAVKVVIKLAIKFFDLRSTIDFVAISGAPPGCWLPIAVAKRSRKAGIFCWQNSQASSSGVTATTSKRSRQVSSAASRRTPLGLAGYRGQGRR